MLGLSALLTLVGGPLVASLGGASALAAVLPAFKTLRRFKWPIMILAGVFACATGTLVAIGKHAAAVEAHRAAAHEAGRSEEETKWKLAAAQAADRNRVERQQDQSKIRDINLALIDARAQFREKQDEFDRAMLDIENAGGSDNRFDPRVVRALNAGGPRPGGAGQSDRRP